MTRIYRDKDGWKAETEIEIADTGRLLKLRTYRDLRGALVTSATSWKKNTVTGGLSHAMGFGSGGDFSKTVFSTRPPRVTESVLGSQHQRALADLGNIKMLEAAHYSPKECEHVPG